MGSDKGSSIPDFSKYMNNKGEGKNKVFSYFMVGTMGALSAAGAKSTVQGTFFFSPPKRIGLLLKSIGRGGVNRARCRTIEALRQGFESKLDMMLILFFFPAPPRRVPRQHVRFR